MVSELDLAWLAGWWDGEGSIGIALQHSGSRGWVSLTPSVQASFTDRPALDKIIEVLGSLGITGLGYEYQEKDPTKHKNSWHVRVNRLTDIRILAPRVMPYAVIKRDRWELILEFANSRLEGRELEPSGRVKRGGNTHRPWKCREIEIAVELRRLNHRGPHTEEVDEWIKTLRESINEHARS